MAGDDVTARLTLRTGECLDVMRRELADESVDAVVTDPPYGLGFMGKQWDKLPPGREWAEECLRVLKPGGFMLTFGGARTWHRLAVAVEDAGFELRDSIAWLYGSGFPKSLDVSKAIDKAAGADRVVLSEGSPLARMIPGADQNRTGSWIKDNGREFVPTVTDPATEDAQRWDGWGTALKPAFEPIIVARKPFRGTVVDNVLAHGTGAVNIDACRIGVADADYARNHSGDRGHAGTRDTAREGDTNLHVGGGSAHDKGRWPANVALDESQADALDEQAGLLKSGANPTRRNSPKFGDAYGDFPGGDETPARGVDVGGASRFFYVAKAPKKERPIYDDRGHPTVKPLTLMRWLVRLVTPPDGLVLDMFLGSGTTAEAALLEGFRVFGIERELHSMQLTRVRLSKLIGAAS